MTRKNPVIISQYNNFFSDTGEILDQDYVSKPADKNTITVNTCSLGIEQYLWPHLSVLLYYLYINKIDYYPQEVAIIYSRLEYLFDLKKITPQLDKLLEFIYRDT